MERYKLGELFGVACQRISIELTELYESLYDEDGEAVKDLDKVNAYIKIFQKQVSLEADFIRQSIREHNDRG